MTILLYWIALRRFSGTFSSSCLLILKGGKKYPHGYTEDAGNYSISHPDDLQQGKPFLFISIDVQFFLQR